MPPPYNSTYHFRIGKEDVLNYFSYSCLFGLNETGEFPANGTLDRVTAIRKFTKGVWCGGQTSEYIYIYIFEILF